MTTERNYDNTGEQQGSGGVDVWLNLNGKTGVLSRNGVPINTFVGYMDTFNIRFDPGNVEKRIAPSYKLTLKLSAKDGDSIKSFGLDIGGHLAVICPEITNALLGTGIDWDGYMSISTYMKNDKVRIAIKTKPGQDRYTPGIPWDPAVNRYQGCPDAPVTGIDPNTGQELRNHWPARAFWFRHALTLYQRFNGRAFAAPADMQQYLRDRLAIFDVPTADASTPPPPTPMPTAPPPTTGPVAAPPPPVNPSTNVTATDEPVASFLGLCRTHISKCETKDSIIAIVERCLGERDKRNLTSVTDEMILELATPKACAIWGTTEGVGCFVVKSRQPYTVQFDDLPF